MVVTYNEFNSLSMDISKIRVSLIMHACKGSITESNMSAEILQDCTKKLSRADGIVIFESISCDISTLGNTLLLVTLYHADLPPLTNYTMSLATQRNYLRNF